MKRRLGLGFLEGVMGSEKLCPRNIPEQALKDDGSDPVKNQSQEKQGERGLNRGSQQRRLGRQGSANRASLRQEEGYFTGEKVSWTAWSWMIRKA